MKRKKLSELNLTDDFLFGEVMSEPEICKGVLECILNTHIERVELVQTEKSFKAKYDRRGIRLDVYASDNNNVLYNVEMQNIDYHDIPRRMRYSQGQLDVSMLEEGIDDYNELNDTIIIFICDFDPFGKERYIYSFKNIEIDDNSLTLDDGTAKIFISTRGKGEVRKELKDFLEYAKCSTTEEAEKSGDSFLKDLNEKVTCVKKSKSTEERFMVYEKIKYGARLEGRAEAVSYTHLTLPTTPYV